MDCSVCADAEKRHPRNLSMKTRQGHMFEFVFQLASSLYVCTHAFVYVFVTLTLTLRRGSEDEVDMNLSWLLCLHTHTHSITDGIRPKWFPVNYTQLCLVLVPE